MKESQGWQGEFKVIIGNEEYTIKNRITNQSLNLMRDLLNGEGDAGDLEIKYLALGDSDKPLDDNDTTLDNELFRTPFISTAKPQTGRLQKTAVVLDSEAVFHIKELGIFAGSATEGADTGFLISRVLFNRDKTSLESIQFVRTDTIGRG